MNCMRIVFVVLFVGLVGFAQADQVGDMDGDGQVGLTEAIIALQVAAGIVPAASLGQYIQATGDAAAGDVLVGKTFSSKEGSDILGTMYNNGAGSTITPGQTGKFLYAGYWSSSNYIQGDEDLAWDNIRIDINIFGVEGGLKCVRSEIGIMSGQARVECDFQCDNTYPLQGMYWHGCRYGCYLSNDYIHTIFDNNCD
jgi:hypothetical protein